MTDQQETDRHPSNEVPKRASAMRFLVPTLIALSGVAALVYLNRPKPVEYKPGPEDVPKVKTVAEIKNNIANLKAVKNIPPGEKERIIGFLNIELERAKARESGEPVGPSQPNPSDAGPPGPQGR